MSEIPILKILDLSTNHLPKHLAAIDAILGDGALQYESDALNETLGVTTYVHPRGHGFICYVPGAQPDDAHVVGVPDEMSKVLEYAREHDCSFVNFDADGEVCDDLPIWEW